MSISVRKFILQVLVACCCLVVPRSSTACDCAPSAMTVKRFHEYDAIFLGRLRSQTVSNDTIRYVFSISASYQGDASGEAVVFGPLSPSYCGIGPLNDTSQYLIYAHRVWDVLWTSRCHSPVNSRTELPFDNRRDITLLQLLSAAKQKSGTQQIRDAGGTLLAVGRHAAGKAEGRWIYFNGAHREAEGLYHSGEKDSIWTEYDYNTGKIDRLEKYDKGKPTAWQKTYYSGRLHSESVPLTDTSKWVRKIYHDNGRVRVRSELAPPRTDKYGRQNEGSMQGLTREFYENGKLMEEGYYHRGFATGIHKFYDSAGRLLRTERNPEPSAIDEQMRIEK